MATENEKITGGTNLAGISGWAGSKLDKTKLDINENSSNDKEEDNMKQDFRDGMIANSCQLQVKF